MKNIPATFYPDPIWNAGALGLTRTTRGTRWGAIWDHQLRRERSAANM